MDPIKPKVVYISWVQANGEHIDGPLLAKSVLGVGIRAGQGTWVDTKFWYNYNLCLENKIPFFIWWFLQPNMLADYQIAAFMKLWNQLPVKPTKIALDVEEIDYRGTDGKMYKLFPPSRRYSHDNIMKWCTEIAKQTRAHVGIYTRKLYFEEWTFETEDWYQFWMWVAAWYNYTGAVDPGLPWNWPRYDIHQWQGGGLGTPGIDPNPTCKEYFNGSLEEGRAWFGGKEIETVPIWKPNVPMSLRAWIMDIDSDQKIAGGFQSLGVDGYILPMVKSYWDGNHQQIERVSSFNSRAALIKQLNTIPGVTRMSVFGKIQLDAAVVYRENHSIEELNGHETLVNNLVVPKIIDVWHNGPWTPKDISSSFAPLDALIFEQVNEDAGPYGKVNSFWQAEWFKYVVDHLRSLMSTNVVPTVPIILKTTEEFLKDNPPNSQFDNLLRNNVSWLWLAIKVETLSGMTGSYPDLWSIYQKAPGDSFGLMNIPDVYRDRVVMLTFTEGKQKLAGLTDSTGQKLLPISGLSKWCDAAEDLPLFFGAEPLPEPPPSPEPPPDPTIDELKAQIADLTQKNDTLTKENQDLTQKLSDLKVSLDAWKTWFVKAPTSS